ncbi:uncharacterized protein si:ch73-347e22.8 [Etheostoma cragini]|uniref:uncharacterized protein si:ch73-347e22.8 n=1 Tax=Etheostoma cragini TaxID=417921 RepID=UPI00155E9DE7|nr:uncharacterized protein si:ch73-347e22.8 [Etheostoma cragini]XP_034748773.1 uncharacterized protein si:ch73-347e22.8 [Etheostoma cragini]
MRVQWMVTILCTLLSMGLVVIIVGQHQVTLMLDKANQKLPKESQKLDDKLSDLRKLKASVEKLLSAENKAVKNLEESIPKLIPEIEKKRIENDACQGEKKTKGDELAAVEKEHTETLANLKQESDAWNQEINDLKPQVTGYREICNHVKKGTLAEKLCSTS